MTSNVAKSADANQHIKDYLGYYLALKHAPHYAVMLNGPWGIGKTYFIEKFLENQFPDKSEYIYVSLYGVSSKADMDAALFAAIYPHLIGSKVAKIAGRLTKTALKYFKVDLDIRSADLLNKFQDRVYVFDDLERCEAPINETFGYINEFVEHGDCKVLIVANEVELKGGDEYKRRREKLIGKTLEVKPSFSEALAHFIGCADDRDTKEFLEKKMGLIGEIFEQSGLKNLRILQQTIWDFERLFGALNANHKGNDEAMSALLRLFFSLSFEAKAGRIALEDMQSREMALWLSRPDKDTMQATPIKLAAERYVGTNIGDSILSDALLGDMLTRGLYDKEAIRESIDRSYYFVSKEDEPAWRVVWHGFERADADFNKAMREIGRQFQKREIVIPGVLLHVIGLRFWLSDIGIIKKNRSELVREAKEYIDDLYAKKRLEPFAEQFRDPFRFDGYDGLGIHEAKTPEYRELFEYLESKRCQVTVDRYPEQAAVLLKEMSSDPDVFYRRLCFTNSPDNTYVGIPILASISARSFVTALFRQTPVRQRKILSAFESRYQHDSLRGDLAKEANWLMAVRAAIAAKLPKLSQISRVRISKLLEWYVDPALTKLGVGEPAPKI